MYSPTITLAAEFWKRHRLGLSGVALIVLVFAIVCMCSRVSRNDVLVYSIPFAIGLCYVVGVFAYGFEAPLEGPESGFPARLFLLPVRTSVLVGSPMLQGIVISVVLLMCWQQLVLSAGGVEVPGWCAVMLAATVASSQAILWFPFGLPWLRLLVCGVVFFTLIEAPAVYTSIALYLGVSEEWVVNPVHQNVVLSLVGAMIVPAAFLLAWTGVSRSRRGDSLDWLVIWRPARLEAENHPQRPPFASAFQAQVWYEWRTRGRGYVILVVLFLAMVIVIALIFESRGEWFDFGLFFLILPPMLAALWGSRMGSTGEKFGSTALTTFSATRPLSEADMVSAKLRAATRATVTAWTIVLAAACIWFGITDGFVKLASMWERYVGKHGSEKATGFCVLLAVGLVLGTWRALVTNLWVGLSGRAWVMTAQMIFFMLVASVFLSMANRVLLRGDQRPEELLLTWLPWIFASAVVLKFILTSWALRSSYRRGQLKSGAAIKLVGLWLVSVLGLIALFACFVPSMLVPFPYLIFTPVLFLPLARLANAPLALAWNRHR